MTFAKLVATMGLAGLLLSGPAFAQTAAPAASMTAPTMAPATDKKAKAKQCSMQADQQGLHGKARKAFRSKCKAGSV